jgi:hypothetical protein
MRWKVNREKKARQGGKQGDKKHFGVQEPTGQRNRRLRHRWAHVLGAARGVRPRAQNSVSRCCGDIFLGDGTKSEPRGKASRHENPAKFWLVMKCPSRWTFNSSKDSWELGGGWTGPGIALDVGPRSPVESTIARCVRRRFCRAARLRSLTGRRIIRNQHLNGRFCQPRLYGRGLLDAGVFLKDLAKLALTVANDLQEVLR